MKTTTDYASFKFLDYNREINPAHVKKLAKSMKEFGFLIPVLVTEDMTLFDGGHRVKGAEIAEVPVSYLQLKIAPDRLPQVVAMINSTSKNWTMKDYLSLYCDLANEHYLQFQQFLTDSSIVVADGLRILMTMNPGKKGPKGRKSLSGSSGGVGAQHHGIGDKFKSGDFMFIDGLREAAEKVANQIMEIREFSPIYESFKDDKKFIHALVVITTTRSYDHNRMMAQLTKMANRLGRCPSPKDYIINLCQIYDYSRSVNLLQATVKAA